MSKTTMMVPNAPECAPSRQREAAKRATAFTPMSRRRAKAAFRDESGAATAEYAIATMAAVAFAGLLVVIMRSDEVKQILTDLINRALTVAP